VRRPPPRPVSPIRPMTSLRTTQRLSRGIVISMIAARTPIIHHTSKRNRRTEPLRMGANGDVPSKASLSLQRVQTSSNPSREAFGGGNGGAAHHGVHTARGNAEGHRQCAKADVNSDKSAIVQAKTYRRMSYCRDDGAGPKRSGACSCHRTSAGPVCEEERNSRGSMEKGERLGTTGRGAPLRGTRRVGNGQGLDGARGEGFAPFGPA
jgi:hypothetical protein